jgi:release factor glutamine methyltransferase
VNGVEWRGPASEVRRRIARRLIAAGIEGGMLEARLLLARALDRDAVALISDRDLIVDGPAVSRLADWVARRVEREPLAYILGEREFWSLPIAVTSDVLIPRPDSETVIEAALHAVPDRRRALSILDLGTGSGCLLLALLSEYPSAIGLGVDISGAALRIARDNAVRLGLAHRTRFVCSNWDRALGHRRFDLVVSNPPYVRGAEMMVLALDVRRYEPTLALAGGSDGLAAYRRVLPACRRRLAAGGRACVEIAAARLGSITQLGSAAGLQVIDVRHDLARRPRCLVFSKKKSAWKPNGSGLLCDDGRRAS